MAYDDEDNEHLGTDFILKTPCILSQSLFKNTNWMQFYFKKLYSSLKHYNKTRHMFRLLTEPDESDDRTHTRPGTAHTIRIQPPEQDDAVPCIHTLTPTNTSLSV
jgi:hypothetical protein